MWSIIDFLNHTFVLTKSKCNGQMSGNWRKQRHFETKFLSLGEQDNRHASSSSLLTSLLSFSPVWWASFHPSSPMALVSSCPWTAAVLNEVMDCSLHVLLNTFCREDWRNLTFQRNLRSSRRLGISAREISSSMTHFKHNIQRRGV